MVPCARCTVTLSLLLFATTGEPLGIMVPSVSHFRERTFPPRRINIGRVFFFAVQRPELCEILPMSPDVDDTVRCGQVRSGA